MCVCGAGKVGLVRKAAMIDDTNDDDDDDDDDDCGDSDEDDDGDSDGAGDDDDDNDDDDGIGVVSRCALILQERKIMNMSSPG